MQITVTIKINIEAEDVAAASKRLEGLRAALANEQLTVADWRETVKGASRKKGAA
jgi:hypothetical protein